MFYKIFYSPQKRFPLFVLFINKEGDVCVEFKNKRTKKTEVILLTELFTLLIIEANAITMNYAAINDSK